VGAVLTRRRSRLLAGIVALALVTAGCGGGRSDDEQPGTIGSTLATTPGDESTTSAGGPGGITPTTRRASSATTKGASGSGSGTPTTSSRDLRDAANGIPGAFAGFVLAPGPADAIVLDVLVQAGVSADGATTAAIRDILAAASGKPVSLRGPVGLDASGNVHSADDIRRLATDQGRAQGSGVAVIHVLYLAGEFTDDSALGVAVRGDTMAVFPEQMNRVASPFVSRTRIERAVVTHELGHILGLVDIYLEQNSDDPEHPGHSTNPQSVMYWAVESDVVGQVLGGPPPIAFDGADQNDLRRIHEGAPPAR
jgi:hypothetical protein